MRTTDMLLVAIAAAWAAAGGVGREIPAILSALLVGWRSFGRLRWCGYLSVTRCELR